MELFNSQRHLFYTITGEDYCIAVDISQRERLINLYSKYSGFASIPNDYEVEGIILQYYRKEGLYYLTNEKKNYKVNQLSHPSIGR